MVKVFIIIGLLLVVTGVPGLYWYSFQNDQLQQRIDFCKAKYGKQVDEYVRKLTGSSLSVADPNGFDRTTAVNMEKMTPVQRRGYQTERLFADIDELAQSQKTAPVNADSLYGDNWRQRVADYKDKKQFLATIQVVSVTASLAGGVLVAAAFIFMCLRMIIGGVRWIVGICGIKTAPKSVVEQTMSVQEPKFTPPPVVSTAAAQTSKSPNPTAEEFRRLLVAQTESLKETADQLKDLATVLQHRADEHDQALAKRLEKGFKSQTDSFKHENNLLKALAENIQKAVETQSGDLSRVIENSVTSQTAAIAGQTEKSLETSNAAQKEAMQLYADGLSGVKQQINELTRIVGESISQKSGAADVSEKVEQLFNVQTENLKSQIEPLREIAGKLEQIQGGRPAEGLDDRLKQETAHLRHISEESLQKNDAIGKSIIDLTEQVGAIREYAARQQHHLAKLQDGYDWNLIKNFCLRVIRCIDNLDDRIGEISCNGGNAEHLQAVREELAFILESNGIEPFGAKIDSDYRGQESRLQVLNERDETDDGNLIGKIAQVVRAGYQYRVNDEYTKIVRPAHVRLYGSAFAEAAGRPQAQLRGE